jgi:hypothetical protein
MKRFLSIKSFVVALAILFGTLPVSATERPFSLNGKGVASIAADGPVPVGSITGSGTATHLGLFTNTATIYFNPDPTDPTVAHPSGEGVFIAANGDKLNIVVENASMSLLTGMGGGTFRINGGTGRFANATGSLTAVVEQNLITGAYEVTAVGKIDY